MSDLLRCIGYWEVVYFADSEVLQPAAIRTGPHALETRHRRTTTGAWTVHTPVGHLDILSGQIGVRPFDQVGQLIVAVGLIGSIVLQVVGLIV